MLQVIYIAVGILFIITICCFLLCQMFHWFCDNIERIKWERYNWYTTKKYSELALVFHQDKKLEFIFNRLAKDQIWGNGLDVWKFRDEIEKKFGRD